MAAPTEGAKSSSAQLKSLRFCALPPRPKALLEGVMSVVTGCLQDPMNKMLGEIEQNLFRATEQSRFADEQQRSFEALLEFRRNRADILPRFFAATESQLANITDVQVAKDRSAKLHTLQSDNLSLLDDERLEETIVLHEISARAEIRNSGELYLLGHRLGVLSEKPYLDEDCLPIGPNALSECLRFGQEHLDILVAHRVLIFRAFESAVVSNFGKMYEDINQYLVSNRVLPNFTVRSSRAVRRSEIEDEMPREPVASIEDRATVNKDKSVHVGNESANDLGNEPQDHSQFQSQFQTQIQSHSQTQAHLQSQGMENAGRRRHADQYSGGPEGAPQSTGDDGSEGLNNGSWDSLIESAFSDPMVGWPGLSALDSMADKGAPQGAFVRPRATAGMNQGVSANGLNAAFSPPHAQQRQGATTQNGTTQSSTNQGPTNQGPTNQGTAPTGTGSAASSVPSNFSPVFDELRQLLSQSRQRDSNPVTPPMNAHQVDQNDVQSVLGLMQMKPPQPMMVGGRVMQKGVSHLKQDLLNQLRRVTPEGKQPQLSSDDSDTFDLVGMMFEQVQKELPSKTTTQGLFNKLQVPLLRVALNDKSFFTERSHPARRMLNSIGETTNFWLDEKEPDKELVNKLHVMVDRVASEFNGDVAVFDQMVQDLHQHLNLLGRKSEVTERRQVETARGREKLDVARATAVEAVSNRVNSNPNLSEVIKALLEQAWTDVLALTVLRNGIESAVYRARLGVADRLIDLESLDENRHRAELFKSIRGDLETGLMQVGYHGEDIERLFSVLLGPESLKEINNESPIYRELAPRIKAKVRLGEHGQDLESHRKIIEKRVDLLTRLTPPEVAMLERLKKLPFGTWFEFAQEDGSFAKRKLSWFSTVTGNALFVNQRGLKVEETMIEEIARGLVSGKVKVMERPKESIIDRAFKSIMKTLKLVSVGDVSPRGWIK